MDNQEDFDALNSLKREVSTFVKTKICDAKCTEDVTNIYTFKEYKSLYKDEGFDKFIYLKKILQITLNLYHNFEIFKNIPIKFTAQELDLIPSICIYTYEENSDSWLCCCKPNDDYISDVLVNYILCFMSLEMKERARIDKSTNPSDVKVISNCYFCDHSMKMGDIKCRVCEASIFDNVQHFNRNGVLKEINDKDWGVEVMNDDEELMVARSAMEDDSVILRHTREGETKKRVGRLEDGKNVNDYIDTRIRENEDGTLMAYKRENKYEWNRDAFVKKEITETWRGHKESRNFETFHSDSKLSKLSEGIIDDYESIRSGDFERKYINDIVKRDEKELVENKWKCSVCSLLNSYKVRACEACLKPMDEGGLWICKKCTFWNRFINSKCEVCLEHNDNLVIKYCSLCKKTRISLRHVFCRDCILDSRLITDDGMWMCKHPYCKAWSPCSEEYCRYCGFWRDNLFSSMSRGDPIKMLKDGKVIFVWICFECFKINSEKDSKCKGWLCRKDRFKRNPCRRCGMYGDGKSNICNNCNETI